MTIGTMLATHSTVVSPVAQRGEKRSQIELTSTVGVVVFPKNAVISNRYILQMDLIAEVKVENDKYVLVEHQLDEYGIGNSLQEAQEDLLNSLVDYLTSLEKRENRLADRELHNLQLLRNMLARR